MGVIVRVTCIKDLNPKLATDQLVRKGLPEEGPKAGKVYHSDSYCFYPQWGFYIHLTEFPDPDHLWNAEKFVIEGTDINCENLLYESNKNQIVHPPRNRHDLQAN